MAVYKADILDIELNTGNIARSFLCHNIGKDDTKADRFGVRVYRDGEPESLSGCSIQGYMMRPNGTNLAITGSNTGVSGNEAWVDLPQAAYDYEGQFCLALKLIGGGVTGTIRIIDGMINNTFVDDALVPMQSVPTYQEILAVYDQMVAAKNGSVRFDQSQSLTETQKSVARMNIDAARDSDVSDLKSAIINTDIPTMPAIASFFTGAGNIDFSTSTQTWSANPSRVGNESIFTASSDITLNVKSGFRYIVFIFTSENAYSGNSGWQTGEYTIPAGTHYSLEVSKTATTSAISISEAFSAIYETTLRNDINELTAIADEVTEKIPGVNLFDGIFDESGYINASGNQPSTNFKRTSKYYPIVGSDSNIIYFYLSQTVDTFSVLFYDANRNYVPGIVSVNNVQTKLGLIPSGAKYFRAYTRTAYSGDVTIALSQVDHYIPYQPIPAIKSNSIGFLQLTEDVVDAIGKPVKYAYVNGIADGVITGLYMLDAMYSFNGIEASASRYRLRFKKNGNLFVIGEDVSEEYYSDKILKVVVGTDLIGYAIIHYPVGGYAITSDSLSYTSSATNLDDNPVIKSYLARSENLVLVGDSMFGNYGQNCLESLLSMISDKQVFNCGFGGCRMAWRNATGSNAYDVFSFVSVADAIASGNYSAQIAQRSLNNGYPPRISALKSIDWSRPTTLFVEYVNNDITGDVAIGDLWDNTQTEFDKQTVLGAFNYGIKTILTAYPHVRVVQFTSAWRKLGSDAVPPYEYKNALNLGPADYDAAIKINAERQGISVYDYFRYGGRSWHNRDYYQVDNSHYNDKGYYMFARKLNALDHSFMD